MIGDRTTQAKVLAIVRCKPKCMWLTLNEIPALILHFCSLAARGEAAPTAQVRPRTAERHLDPDDGVGVPLTDSMVPSDGTDCFQGHKSGCPRDLRTAACNDSWR